jgi:hypothetical protein
MDKCLSLSLSNNYKTFMLSEASMQSCSHAMQHMYM